MVVVVVVVVVGVVDAAGAGRVLAGDDPRSASVDTHAPSTTIATTTPTLEYIP